MSRVSGVSARANPLQLLLLSLSTLSCQSVKCNSSTPSTFVFKRFSAEESAASLGEGKREREAVRQNVCYDFCYMHF